MGNSSEATQQLVVDSAIPAGTLIIPSRTTAGFGGIIPNLAGVYWCYGLSVSTSEGLGTLIELDGGRFPVSVDEIT